MCLMPAGAELSPINFDKLSFATPHMCLVVSHILTISTVCIPHASVRTDVNRRILAGGHANLL